MTQNKVIILYHWSSKCKNNNELKVNIIVVEETVGETEIPELLQQFQNQIDFQTAGGASKLAILLIAAFTALVLVLLVITASIIIR